ncbi:NAD(P)-dependent oxidoreductase [Indiicoccus explosivorum]|uniref:NAD(P)-dependent oxidoreductase n=1 Tax=Indiicoccus explosivorum TaxID=1917864 RepID=UPI000B441280|nr:NAD(P)-dependent oxidoreductase [Indiicoccus explosivorum]
MAIAFIGTGVMGKSMVRHLLKAGKEVIIYTRTREKAEDLIGEGAMWAESPAAAASGADKVLTMVGYPADVEEVYFGENGILGSVRKGTILVDLTTSQPALAKRIAEKAEGLGCQALDAPVSGGDTGAANGTLSIMVGGDREVLERIRPLLSLFGTNIVHQGPPGAGQHTKMCNQITIASTMTGVCESLIYARKAGLDPETVLRSISAGAAGSWSLSNLVPRMIEEDFRPGFYIKHFIKDMKIAAEESEKMGLELPALRLALEMYEELAEQGYAEAGTQALIKHYT